VEELVDDTFLFGSFSDHDDVNIPNVGKYVFSKHSESILLVAVLS
jgi:hypothetical protein